MTTAEIREAAARLVREWAERRLNVHEVARGLTEEQRRRQDIIHAGEHRLLNRVADDIEMGTP